MGFKTSKFNYCVRNKEGDFLLYNSLRGKRSLYKVKQDKLSDLQYLNISGLIENENEVTQKLINSGYLIPEDYDEDILIEETFDNKVNDKLLNLIIAPTSQCNLRCKYCCENFEANKMPLSIQNSIIFYVEKNIGNYSGVNIDWFGGEPLLAMDVIENIASRIIEICTSHKKIYTSFITTNGTLLDLKIFERLYKLKVIMYQITVDGIQEVHDKQRVGVNDKPTFNKIIHNLEAIRDSNVGRHALIMILTNYSNVMKEYIDEYKVYFEKHFGHDRRFYFSCNIIMDLGGDQIDCYRNNLVDSKGMNYLYEKIIENDDAKLSYIYEEFLEPGSQLCYAAKRNSFLIGEDGLVYKCEHQYQIHKDENIGYFDLEGNLILTKEADKWMGRYDFCKNPACKLKPLCLGEDCIKQRVNLDNQNPGGENCGFHECHFFKPSLESILKLLDHEKDIFPIF